MKYLFLFISFLTLSCSDADDVAKQIVERKALDDLGKEIAELAGESVCSEEFSCDFVGFGVKACGGSKGYLVYSNSINVVEFIAKVEVYNKLEKEYNIKYGIISDCMLVLPPTGITCDNGKCKAIYSS